MRITALQFKPLKKRHVNSFSHNSKRVFSGIIKQTKIFRFRTHPSGLSWAIDVCTWIANDNNCDLALNLETLTKWTLKMASKKSQKQKKKTDNCRLTVHVCLAQILDWLYQRNWQTRNAPRTVPRTCRHSASWVERGIAGCVVVGQCKQKTNWSALNKSNKKADFNQRAIKQKVG